MTPDPTRARHLEPRSVTPYITPRVAAACATTLATAVGAAATRASYGVLARHPPGGAQRWSRTNHAGRRVTLLEGPSVVVGVVTGAVIGAVCARLSPPAEGPGGRLGGTVAGGLAGAGAALLAGAVGAVDDLGGDSTTKGLRGHLGALREGRVTTGALKIGGLAGAGAIVALTRLLTGRRAPSASAGGSVVGGSAASTPVVGAAGGPLRAVVDVVVDLGVVAGSANLVNLLDLRPGRALKVAVAGAVPLAAAGCSTAGSVVGAALVALPADLAGQRMLGDTGANALGAALGAAVVDRSPRAGRLALLCLLVALTLLSERVSFTEVIESTPGLRALDAWGREPRVGAGA